MRKTSSKMMLVYYINRKLSRILTKMYIVNNVNAPALSQGKKFLQSK